MGTDFCGKFLQARLNGGAMHVLRLLQCRMQELQEAHATRELKKLQYRLEKLGVLVELSTRPFERCRWHGEVAHYDFLKSNIMVL